MEINGQKMSFEDLKLVDKQLVNQKAIEVEFGGQSPNIFFSHPSNLKMYKLITNFNKDLLDQIFSTFKFN